MLENDGTTLSLDTITLTEPAPDTYRAAWATISGLPDALDLADALGIPQEFR